MDDDDACPESCRFEPQDDAMSWKCPSCGTLDTYKDE